jgi:hypothetical protein
MRDKTPGNMAQLPELDPACRCRRRRRLCCRAAAAAAVSKAASAAAAAASSWWIMSSFQERRACAPTAPCPSQLLGDDRGDVVGELSRAHPGARALSGVMLLCSSASDLACDTVKKPERRRRLKFSITRIRIRDATGRERHHEGGGDLQTRRLQLHATQELQEE